MLLLFLCTCSVFFVANIFTAVRNIDFTKKEMYNLMIKGEVLDLAPSMVEVEGYKKIERQRIR